MGKCRVLNRMCFLAFDNQAYFYGEEELKKTL